MGIRRGPGRVRPARKITPPMSAARRPVTGRKRNEMNATARKHIAKSIKEIDAALWGIPPQDQNSIRLQRAYLILSLFADGYELSTQYRPIRSKRGPGLVREAQELIKSLETER